MNTLITPMDPGTGTGPLLAVKDLIDVAGVPTTAGSRAVADGAEAAIADARCMAGARKSCARLIGKANLVELGYGSHGLNDWFGTPVNPLDRKLAPGGSSSGCAVAVATGLADVAFGSDTGGSIRVPAAFCGTAGLKTTYGRIPTEGVWPLAPSLDTVGPMARDVTGLALGMVLLEPGFSLNVSAARLVGRLLVPGIEVDPAIDAAVDRALALAEVEVVEIAAPAWPTAYVANVTITASEAAQVNRRLMQDSCLRSKLSPSIAARLDEAAMISEEEAAEARLFSRQWADDLNALFRKVQVLAGPTVPFFPPPLEKARKARNTILTQPVNLAGLPALSLPIPTGRDLPAGLQLIGPSGCESLLLATGVRFENALRAYG